MMINNEIHIPNDYLVGCGVYVTPHSETITVKTLSKTGGYVSFDLTEKQANELISELQEHVNYLKKL